MSWIGVDLDGTLAKFSVWNGPTSIGDPIPAMVQRVKDWLMEGYEVRIFTARITKLPTGEIDEEAVKAIEDWCLQHIGKVLPVTNAKDYGCVAIYDDLAIQVEYNTGRIIGRDYFGQN